MAPPGGHRGALRAAGRLWPLTAVIGPAGRGLLAIDLVLRALAAAWMLFMFTLHPAWRDRPGG